MRLEQFYGREQQSLFYTKGALFWRELDQTIASASRGETDLDEYLPLLLNAVFAPDGGLPQEFSDQVGEVIGLERLQEINDAFLE